MEEKKDIGAWEQVSEKGEKYWRFKLPDGKSYRMFQNKFKKEGDNQPTFRIFLNEEKVQSEKSKNDDLPF